MRSFIGPTGFQGAMEAATHIGSSAFLLSPGDFDPPQDVFNMVQMVLGAGYPWYPVVGNHSFDWGKAHLAVVNEYFDGSVDNAVAGDVSPALLDGWRRALRPPRSR